MELSENIKILLYDGVQVDSLIAAVNSREFYSRKLKKDFNLYYVEIRIKHDFFSSNWCGDDENNAFLLEVSEQEYIEAAEKYSHYKRQVPCVISYFKTEADAQRFIDEFVLPKLLGTKLKYMDKRIINGQTFIPWE